MIIQGNYIVVGIVMNIILCGGSIQVKCWDRERKYITKMNIGEKTDLGTWKSRVASFTGNIMVRRDTKLRLWC